MKKINKLLLSTFALASVATPIFATVACGTKEKAFDPVRFNNQVFTSKSDLLSYINSNIDKLSDTTDDNKVFSITEAGDQKTFPTYQDALDYIGNKIVTKTVYLNENALKSGAKISPTDFVEKSQTEKYYVFEKWTKTTKDDGQGNKVEQHEYSYVSTNASNEEINKARLEAASTYIQVHNGYCFNGVYFANSSELTQYLQLELDKVASNSQISSTGLRVTELQSSLLRNNQMKRIFLKNGTSFDFEDKNNLASDSTFRNWVNQNAKPYFVNQSENNPLVEFPLNNQNQANIAANIDEKELIGIRVENNNGKITQVVDMDSSTPNGRIYGGYFVESGESIDGVINPHNWNRASDINQNSIIESNNIQVVKSFIDYILTAQGISSPIQLMENIKIDNQNQETFFDYLRSKNSSTGHGTYFDKAKELFNTLSRGSRYSTLDTIISLHSYLINLMIQDKQNTDEIFTLSKYFSSMTKVLDSYTSLFLAPFFTSSKDSSETISNFKINYFENAFHFFDDSNNHGISFQSNPYSYYRTLIGHQGDKNGEQQIAYFNLIKAMMGMQAISMKALNINQLNIVNWLVNPNVKNLEFTTDSSQAKNNGKIWDFKFKGINAENDSEEYKSIWSNLSSQMELEVDNKVFNTQVLKNNFNDYLTKYQNLKIDSYLNNISDFSKQVYTLITGKDYLNQNKGIITDDLLFTKWDISSDLRNDLSKCIDTFQMIDIDKSNLHSNIISSDDEYAKFEKMQDALVDSIDTRIANFVNQVGQTTAQIGSAVIAAAQAARANNNANQKVTKTEETSVTMVHDVSISTQLKIASLQGQNQINPNFDFKQVVTANQRIRITSLQTKITTYQTNSKTALSNNQLKTMNAIFSKLAPEINLSLHNNFNDQYQKIDYEQSIHESYDQYLKTNPTPVKSFEDFQKELEANDKNVVSSPTINNDLDDNIHKLLSAHTNNGIASLLGMATGSSSVEAIASLAINMASAIIPGLSIANSLINFLTSFEGSKQVIYTYGQHEEGTRFFWDGGEVDYSWWGLSQSVKYSISDLKMIVSPDIISAYESSGYYFDGKIYSDTVQLRAQTANKLIEDFNKIQVNDAQALSNKNIEWRLELQGDNKIVVSPGKANALDDFYSRVASNAIQLSKNIYMLKNGVLTTDTDAAKKDFIEKIVQALSECTIIVLPTKHEDGSVSREEEFPMPRPFWSAKDGLVNWKEDEKAKQANYIVKNPNVNPDLAQSISNPNVNQDIVKNLIKDEAKAVNPTAESIKELINQYASNIVVPSRENIFEDLRDPQNSSYEDLENTQWSTDPTNIYSFTKIDSLFQTQIVLDAYYPSRSTAMSDALKSRYRINAMTKSNFGVAYRFRVNNQIYHSIDQIYEWIINNQKEGEKHE